ncbi:MAG: ATP-binding cassette domain-containing protein [Defluviitaleaceae bacterium]|nr:ATP-binding cassette domain-containing protein [Defluviitaleaceae bacterium]
MDVIKVTNLTKKYVTHKRGSGFGAAVKSLFKREKVEVVAADEISFSVKKGSICGLIGPNGAGKSTTIKMLCGSLYPTSGTIESLGMNPYHERKKYVRRIGAVFGQRSQLVWDIPPIDSFNMNRAIYGIGREDYKSRLSHLAGLFEIEEVMQKPTRVLSLGERMKCEFIMAMLHNPEIVFLDEPTIGLDILAKTKIRDFIREINAAGTTFILTTHDLEDISQLAEHVIIINHGKKVFDDELIKLQHFVGEKKIIELTLPQPFNAETLHELNVRLVKEKSSHEIVIEADTAQQSVGELIEKLSRKMHFTDISVKALPMEEIIAKIYSD